MRLIQLSALAVMLVSIPATSCAANPWTIRKIVEAPKDIETKISEDGREAVYVVRQDHLSSNTRDSTLYRVDLLANKAHLVLKSAMIDRVTEIPGTHDWALLADFGAGIQLYRLSQNDIVTPVKVSSALVTIGSIPSKSVFQTADEPDQAYGIFDYGYAPDGQSFWYSTAHEMAKGLSSVRTIVAPEAPYPRFLPNTSELHWVDGQGADLVIASHNSDSELLPELYYYKRAATWSVDERGVPSLAFRTTRDLSAEPAQAENMHFMPATKTTLVDPPALPVPFAQKYQTRGDMPGPNGGTLHVDGFWGGRHLEEWRGGQPIADFGKVDFSIIPSDQQGGNGWQFPLEKATVVAVRHSETNPRNDVVKLTSDGRVTSLEPSVSLEKCSFSAPAETGVCVRDGFNEPPALVLVDVRHWTQTHIVDLTDSDEQSDPLRIEPTSWTAHGNSATGFLIYPRGYVPSKRYPLVIVTHGYDAYNSFAYASFQWSYPVQLWAERGFFVACVNDIAPDESAERLAAYAQWVEFHGKVSHDDMMKLVWLDNVAIYQEVVRSLDAAGKIDAALVGITGYSRGSQMTDVAITQTSLFKAASDGDGAFFSPGTFGTVGTAPLYTMLFGGPPYDPEAARLWGKIAPAFRARSVNTAVLFQVSDYYYNIGKIEFFQSLRRAARPAEFDLFSQETHGLHSPWNQRTALIQNLDWFDFWLLGKEDPDPGKSDQYKRWQTLRATHPG